MSFAAGAAVSLVGCSGVYWYRSATEKDANPYLVVVAPHIIPLDAELDDPENVSVAAGNVIRTCGVSTFEIELQNHGYTYSVPIADQNTDALQCIVETIPSVNDDIELSFKVS